MDVWSRARGRVRAWWSAFLAPAPDPRRPVLDAVARQRGLLDRVRHARRDLAIARRQLEARVVPLLGVLDTLEERARSAVAADRDDVARATLERRFAMARELQEIEAQAGDLRREEEALVVVEERLGARIAAFDARQQALAARTSAADAQARVAEELTALSSEAADVAPALDAAERRAEHSQARAAAIERLVDTGVLETFGGDPLQQELETLDRAQAIDERLRRLRREVRPEDRT
jgi:phage shock protein A